ncbi:acyltransferase [Sulfurovum sp. zt1-1]|uniref:Acyltransferase n=1 Tax=Sulfurovum zhangzhouensis TaxID=3019067 RepID=A0ABT7R0G6_9BACT|nr:acyltransferase [Sulfurovum zhangzhouensis]MDM5272551.1 acyltransferase [Sulfurovum zhangzhouensis]
MKILNLLKPWVLAFYLKQLLLLKKNKGKLSIKGYRLSLEHTAQITIEGESKICFGQKTYLRKGTDVEAHNGAIVNIGDNFFMNKNSSIIARYGIEIGDNCMIGENTTIIDHNHVFKDPDLPFKDQGYQGAKITIGDNVWIAGQVFIGQGVSIGDNVVIGANTIVTKDIPSNSIVYNKSTLVIKEIK